MKHKEQKLYHLSEENHDGKYFTPRVPGSIATCGSKTIEDDKHKRVCFSTSISGAYRAVQFNHEYKKMYVHVPDGEIHKRYIKTPTDEQVYDAWYTGEKWITRKVKMKCIGVVNIGYEPNDWRYNRHPVHFKWLKKF